MPHTSLALPGQPEWTMITVIRVLSPDLDGDAR
jgi:hypothetical protein